ncbi:MAG: hypothetical protein VYC56_06375 [Actinomycetota bacterium]|nr:hypothetical protein [Actinomycetota bacterium]MED6328787.1 hypothetical protein [Actinomycetota bacterium]
MNIPLVRIGPLLVAALLVGCGGLGAGAPAGSEPPTGVATIATTTLATVTTTAPPPATTRPPTTTGTAPATTTIAPTTSTAGTSTTTSGAPTTTRPAVLTASFRGVTADAIRVGFTWIDFDEVNRTFGLELRWANWLPAIEALVADLNARGGIGGRRVDLVERSYLPGGSASAQQACLELTADEEVFAVLNGFHGPGAESSNECFGTHETILVGGRPSAEQLALVDAPWITDEMGNARRANSFVRLLARTGVLTDLGPVLVYGTGPGYAAAVDAAADALLAVGAPTPMVAQNQLGGDELAAIAQLEVVLERARAEGYRTVLVAGEAIRVLEYLVGRADEFDLLVHNGESVEPWNSTPPTGIADAGRILTNTRFREQDDESVTECRRVVEASLGHPVLPTDQLGPEDRDHWSALTIGCRTLALFAQVAAAAGPDLTNDSFAEAAASLGEIRIPGERFASLGPAKPDARDGLALAEWDHASLRWVPASTEFDMANQSGWNEPGS